MPAGVSNVREILAVINREFRERCVLNKYDIVKFRILVREFPNSLTRSLKSAFTLYERHF